MLPEFPPNIGKLPRPLHFVRDLEEFDGPILSELRAEKGGLYLEKWCAHDGGTVRTLVVRTEQRAIAEYLAGRMSMLNLLTIPSDDVGFIVDRVGDTIQAVYMIRVSILPPKYLPRSVAYHDPALRPDWDKSPQSFLFDAAWDADLLARIERLYADVFAFTLFTNADSGYSPPGHIFNYDYNRGFPIVQAFNSMRAAVPREMRAKSVGVSANSPGVITIDAQHLTASRVLNAINALKRSEKAYDNLHNWSRIKPEDAHLMHGGALGDLRRLCDLLHVDIRKILPALQENKELEQGEILVAGKLIAAYYRKLWNILEPYDGVEFINVDVAAIRETPRQLFFEEEDEDEELI